MKICGMSVIGKDQTQQLERTNGIVRQQIGRWHRRQNKFAKAWVQTEITVRLAIAYFNWIWVHTHKKILLHKEPNWPSLLGVGTT